MAVAGVYFCALGAIHLVLMWMQGPAEGSWPSAYSLQSVLLLGLIAPVVEELFFRDLVLRALLLKLRNIYIAVFLSSLFFMAAHLSLYPGAFLLGLVSGFIYLYSRSVLPCILFHSLSNLSLYFIPAWFPQIYEALHRWDFLRYF